MAQTKAELEAENAELKERLAAEVAEVAVEDKRTVVQRILAIANEVGVIELEKKGGVPFAYRGIDAVVAKLSPLFNKHGVFAVPTETIQSITQQPAAGKTLTKADITQKYRFYGAGGDFIDAEVPGQADDFADRSSAQAMSVAFRILLLQVFHIPAFGDEEAASQGTMTERENPKVNAARAAQAAPAGPAPALAALQKQVGESGAKKGMTPADLNALGAKVSGATETSVWFNDAAVLSKMLQEINAAPEVGG